jgi:hypothetical protein
MFWKIIAWVVSRPAIADRIIRYADRHPYKHLPGYMNRGWILNPYDQKTHRAKYNWIPFSVRIHHILRADKGRHLHDHPWNARTIILRGAYREVRLNGSQFTRVCGDTARLNFGEYHKIQWVSGGVCTLFITGRYKGVWGFLVKGKKVPHYEYDESTY